MHPGDRKETRMRRVAVWHLSYVLGMVLVLLVARIGVADTRTLKISGVSSDPALNTRVVIDIEGLPEWVQDPGDSRHDPTRALLYLNGQPIPDNHPLVSRENSQLRFQVKRGETDASKAAWAFLLGRPEL